MNAEVASFLLATATELVGFILGHKNISEEPQAVLLYCIKVSACSYLAVGFAR